MRKLIAVTGLLCLIFSSCIKDDVAEKYFVYRPIYQNKAEVLSNIKSAAPTALRNTGKLFLKNNVAYINEVNEGVHIVDYSDPSKPLNKHFIKISGNVDIAVKDNYLYADCYTHLIVVDIADPANVKLIKLVENVFPYKTGNQFAPVDPNLMIVGWQRKDTVINRKLTGDEMLNSSGGGLFFLSSSSVAFTRSTSASGIAGSMSRFALAGDRMYAVTNAEIKVFNTLNASDPQFVKAVQVYTNDVETIFPYNDKLFLGSSTGMMIYSISNPDLPKYVSGFAHMRGCDPVIADGDYAFITIRSGAVCGGFLNQMDVVNIKNLPVTQFVKSYPFSNPQGLSKDGNTIFLCDGDQGLRVLNAANVNTISQTAQIKDFDAYDVIAENGLAIVTAKGGIYFIDYSNMNNVHVKSKISTN
jgi:hypothetical protein